MTFFLHSTANFSQRMISNANSIASHLERCENDNWIGNYLIRHRPKRSVHAAYVCERINAWFKFIASYVRCHIFSRNKFCETVNLSGDCSTLWYEYLRSIGCSLQTQVQFSVVISCKIVHFFHFRRLCVCHTQQCMRRKHTNTFTVETRPQSSQTTQKMKRHIGQITLCRRKSCAREKRNCWWHLCCSRCEWVSR